MDKLLKKVMECFGKKEDFVLITIIASSGSTPRGAGSRMLVQKDGEVTGTIGGGSVEYRAVKMGTDLIEKRESLTEGFDLGISDVSDLGMVCGGKVVVYFQFLSGKDDSAREFFQECLRLSHQDEDSWIFMDITQEKAWGMALYNRKEGLKGMKIPCVERLLLREAGQVEIQGRNYYTEPLVKAGTVYIFGGGHVSQATVPVLAKVGFQVVVADDRKEFSAPELFPQAKGVRLIDFEKIEETITIRKQDYVIIMTRGHQHDYLVQAHALSKKPCYIGIMGSRKKIAFVTQRLLGDGFALSEIERCHMPIGTDIKAETPEEIAISIAGELIACRAGKAAEGAAEYTVGKY